MKLVLNTYGIDLMVEDKTFLLVTDSKKQAFSPEKIESILITSAVTLSSNAIKLALENNIEIQFLDKYGDSYGKIWHLNFGSIATIRKNQLKFAISEKSGYFAKEIIKTKVKKQIDFLFSLKNHRSRDKRIIIDNAITNIQIYMEKIEGLEGNVDQLRMPLMGIEGNISKTYFKVLSTLIPKRYKFIKRTRKPAEDEFNAFLNYGYGMMYSKIEKNLIKAGIDPYIGILHVDNYNRKAFLFDVVERYRVIIDEVVFRLFTRKKVSNKDFEVKNDGYLLNKKGRQLLIRNVNDKFNEKKMYNGRREKIESIIDIEIHLIAKNLLEENECLYG